MSSGRRAGSKPQSQTGIDKGGAKESKPPVQFLPPLKPKPTLAIVLMGVLVLWLIGLVILRVRTVHPAGNPAAAPATR